MKYISTRANAPALTFSEALLAGLPPDGGLYVPETWPSFTPGEIAGFKGRPYADVAFEVMAKFVDGEIADNILRAMIDDAYATFHHPATVPLVQLVPNNWLLELFLGPTLAFKDVARQMGLPIDRLVIATNENDILARTLETGVHKLGEVRPTITPSMDIQISSNFERLLFEASARDADVVVALMRDLKKGGSYTLPEEVQSFIAANFDAGAASEAETLAEIGRLYRETGYLCDPHTAVALHVARQHAKPNVPMITLSTAHPAKFPDAVYDAIGKTPHPPEWADIVKDRAEVVTRLENNQCDVEKFVLAESRLGSGRNARYPEAQQ